MSTQTGSNGTPKMSSLRSSQTPLPIKNKVGDSSVMLVVPKLTFSASKAVQHLRTLLNLILTNSEARKLLSDFGLIGRDLLARSATKVAEALRPDEEQL